MCFFLLHPEIQLRAHPPFTLLPLRTAQKVFRSMKTILVFSDNKITTHPQQALVCCRKLHFCSQGPSMFETRKTIVSSCLMARDNGWKLLHCRPLGLTLIIFLCDEQNLSFIFAQDGTPLQVPSGCQQGVVPPFIPRQKTNFKWYNVHG
jgi:hypothetical protein